jgi:hypothetical protein
VSSLIANAASSSGAAPSVAKVATQSVASAVSSVAAAATSTSGARIHLGIGIEGVVAGLGLGGLAANL